MKYTLIDIRTISKDNRIIKDKKGDKMIAKMEASDARQTKRIIAKLNKFILRAAKQGNFRFYESIDNCYLTRDQLENIERYFTEQGYKFYIEEHTYQTKPNDYIVTMSWY